MLSKISANLEILLYPFRNLSCVDNDEFEKVLKTNKKVKERKILVEDIWKDIGDHTNIRSYDEIHMLLEKHFPILFEESLKQEKEIENSLYDVYDELINNLSKALISHRDGIIVYKSWKNEKDKKLFGPYSTLQKIHIIRQLNQMIPIDFLVCNYLLESNMRELIYLDGYYSAIMLADKQLQGVLQKGIGENHIHFGAVNEFSIMWTNLMNLFARHDRKGINDLDDIISHRGDHKSYYILFACIVRLLLTVFLFEQEEKKENIGQWMEKNRNKDFQRLNGLMEVIWNKQSIEEWACQGEKQSELQIGIFEKLWDEIWKSIVVKLKENYFDYVSEIFVESNGIHTYGENIFLFQALKYRKDNLRDPFFYRIFLQYIRIKNYMFTFIVQQNGPNGLDYFKKYYAQSSTVSGLRKEKLFQKKFQIVFHNPYLKKVEIRISPYKFKQNLKKILEAYKMVIDEEWKKNEEKKNREFPLLGITYHFLKKEDDKLGNKCWMLYQKDEKRFKDCLWYGKLQQEYQKQMKEIINLRNEIPYLSNIIIAFDAASGENDTPVCVFAPVFDQARNCNSQKVCMKTKDGVIIKNKSLCFTFHAGEDFRHMISGLRRIDEVIEHCRFHPGDRIGHGTVLGIKAERWAKNNPIVLLPQGEYLENMLWIWGNLTKSTDYEVGMLLYLEKKIYETAKDIYKIMNGINVPVLYEAYLKRFELLKNMIKVDKYNEDKSLDEMAEKIFCCRVPYEQTQMWDADKLAYAIHCVCYLKEYKKPIQVCVSEQDIRIIQFMQQFMCRKISINGIVVELNPTSNISIGEMDSIMEHQAYALNTMKSEASNSIMVNINSDDPVIFNTNVSNEIAYLYYGLLDQKIGKEKCLKWIDKLRQYGMDTSFVEQVDYNEYYRQLTCILKQLE